MNNIKELFLFIRKPMNDISIVNFLLVSGRTREERVVPSDPLDTTGTVARAYELCHVCDDLCDDILVGGVDGLP